MEEAIGFYRRSIEIFEAHDLRIGAATFRMNLGSALVRRGDLEGAEAAYLETLERYPDIDPALVARLHANLATVLARRPDADPSVVFAYHARAEAISREVGDRLALAQVLANGASYLADFGDPAEALRLGEEARRLLRSLGIRRPEARVSFTLADLRLEQGAGPEALERALAALALAERLPDPILRADAQTHGARAYLWLRQPARALPLLEAAIGAHTEADLDGAGSMAELALALAATGDPEGAARALEAAPPRQREIVSEALRGEPRIPMPGAPLEEARCGSGPAPGW